MTGQETQAQGEQTTLIVYRLSQIEKTLSSLVEQNARIIALEQCLLETREAQERAFKAIKDTDTRVRTIETEMPTLRLVRGWVIAGMLAVIAASGTVMLDTYRRTSMPPAVAAQNPRTG
ncbi:hypothetical protein BKK79_00930 [Cupriavidus sp. USMAA2-4]|uniref:hypothetical protein n=1 Tax=Cupriavidus sp. USMAA2-4 TaxID=876364 RepID=UPI0008A6A046|nr:hypothetical protein [Cupriavidus sp. USMAA2-4]AOY90549.1 hypothetical protein BKK79_00930 [Cupriavidus sp. USMAA2-4]